MHTYTGIAETILAQRLAAPENIHPSWSNAKEVIRTFMRALAYNGLSSDNSADQTIRLTSKNRYGSLAEATERFLHDCRDYNHVVVNTGLNLHNEDTGSIFGSDAEVGNSLNAEDVIPEEDKLSEDLPDVIHKVGLTLYVPSNLSETQKNIVRALNTWWLENNLNMIKEGYGISFEDPGTTFSDMNLRFIRDTELGILAYVNFSTANGQILRNRELVINETYFENYNTSDPNGMPKDLWAKFYLDRIIAHELVHAVMGATMPGFGMLPLFLKEGAAELIHGIDDVRSFTINGILRSTTCQDVLRQYSDPTIKYAVNLLDGDKRKQNQEGFYVTGYLFLRWMAKQWRETFV